jgi:hypothetical protein
MRAIGLLLAVLLGVSGQAPAPASAPARQLEYQFGFNTKPASQGQGTGTTTINILGPAADGGLMVSGQDFWWNTARARATNTCEVHPNGGVSCSERPYAISPIQLTIFSLLGRDYFSGLAAGGTSSWKKTYKITAAIVPGATSPFAGTATTWTCVANLEGKGHGDKSGRIVIVGVTGTMDQQGGRYRQATFKTGIAYDTVAKIPVQIDDTRTHLPQTSVYNNDYVGLKLLKDSQAGT